MEKISNRERVADALRAAMSKDKAKSNILEMSDMGLIEMTRKRTRASLNRLLTDPCFYCEGRGNLKSPKTICYEIFRDIEREFTHTDFSGTEGGHVRILVHPEIDNVLREEEQRWVIDLEKRLGKRIMIIRKKDFHLEQYELSA